MSTLSKEVYLLYNHYIFTFHPHLSTALFLQIKTTSNTVFGHIILSCKQPLWITVIVRCHWL